MHYAISRGWCVVDDTEAVRALAADTASDMPAPAGILEAEAEEPVTLESRVAEATGATEPEQKPKRTRKKVGKPEKPSEPAPWEVAADEFRLLLGSDTATKDELQAGYIRVMEKADLPDAVADELGHSLNARVKRRWG